jgi:ribonuclease P protein component
VPVADGGQHQGLARSERLRKRSDFLKAQSRGRRRSGRHLVVYAMPRTESAPARPSRLGITVSKKVGKAVVRNLVKRWLRESYRQLGHAKVPGRDLVVIAKPTAATASYRVLDTELRHLLIETPSP